GESAVEILGGVLNQEPDISAAPARVHRLLRWCLEKDRKQRLASISDARRLLFGPEAAGLTAQSAQPPLAPRHRSWLPWCIAAFFLLALMPANIFHFSEMPPEERSLLFQVPLPEGAGGNPLTRLSPDG